MGVLSDRWAISYAIGGPEPEPMDCSQPWDCHCIAGGVARCGWSWRGVKEQIARDLEEKAAWWRGSGVTPQDFGYYLDDDAQGMEARRVETSEAQAPSRSDESPTSQSEDAPESSVIPVTTVKGETL